MRTYVRYFVIAVGISNSGLLNPNIVSGSNVYPTVGPTHPFASTAVPFVTAFPPVVQYPSVPNVAVNPA